MPTKPGTRTERDDAARTERTEDAAPTGADGPQTIAETPRFGLIGRFRLVAPLGSGGMADVYRAHDPLLDRAVALKVLRAKGSGDDPQRMRRVLREARAAAALTHPNTVTIFDVGEADGEVFIAMELLEGSVLRRALGREDISLEKKLAWLLQAARALAAAHERGLVHRDVKPDNMFVCSDGALKLLDFGIAKRDEDDSQDGPPNSTGPSSMRTAEGRRVGTPRYMAPEQHAGETTDARTDEYAWGLVAFELLTGTHPATIATAATTATDASTLAGVLRAKAPGLSEELVSTVMRALQSRKEDRFPSMVPIIEGLERAAGSGTFASRAHHAPPRKTRSWILVATGAVAVVAIAAGARSALRSRTAAPVAPLQACRIEPARSLALAPGDRVAIMPNGELATAWSIKQRLALTRETPSGPVAFTSNKLAPMLLANVGAYDDVALLGTNVAGTPWLLVKLTRPAEKGNLLLSMTPENAFNVQLLPPFAVSATAAAPFGKKILLGVTSRLLKGGHAGVQVHVLTDNKFAPRVIESGNAFAPAIAASEKRVGFAYMIEQGGRPALHLALLDESVERVGDVQTIAPTPTMTVPAVAFAGETIAVFWVDNGGTKTRLTKATFAPGQPSVSAPAIAIDEPVTLQPPVTARLPSGQWVVAWVASTGGATKLRVSPIGPGGALTGPTDVATLPSFSMLQATPGDRGVELSWQENDGQIARFAHVACDPSR